MSYLTEDELAHLFASLSEMAKENREPENKIEEIFLYGHQQGLFMESFFTAYSDLIYTQQYVTISQLHAFAIGFGLGSNANNHYKKKTEH